MKAYHRVACPPEVLGVTAAVPANSIDNRVACAGLFENTETLIKATGFERRAVVQPGVTSLDLNVAAAENLLERVSVKREELAAVICVTFTPEYKMPSDAMAAQDRLRLSPRVAAFDVNIACSGYGYGLFLGSLMAQSMNGPVLVLDGDVQSSLVSARDKGTWPVMADAGSATLLAPGGKGEWRFSFYTDGARRRSLYIPAGGGKAAISEEALRYRAYPDGSERRDVDIAMDGFEIFRFVAKDVAAFLAGFIDEAGISRDEVRFVPHQANMYMVDQLAKKLGIPKEGVMRSGQKYGNPASASIPLTLADCLWKSGSGGCGQTYLLSGFGGGLSAFAASVSFSEQTQFEVVLYGEKQ